MADPVEIVGDAYRAVTSKTARRTLVYAILLLVGGTVLYGISVIGYLGFYRDYVPHQVRTAPLYLQYGAASTVVNGKGGRLFAADSALQQHLHQLPHHPFALADLRGLGLKTAQEYDIAVALTVPRSPANLAIGNFMVELVLAASSVSSASSAITAAARLPPANPRDFLESGGKRVVFAAARPGLVAYTDPLVAQASRFLLLPYHLLAAETAERARVVVPMAEALSFGGSDGASSGGTPPTSVLPAVLYLEVRAAGAGAGAQPLELQTYSAEVIFSARLRGLRWLMYHHRILSFALLTTVFWLIEVLFMVSVFVILGVFFSGGGEEGAAENENENNGASALPPPPTLPQIKAEDADDEEEKSKLIETKKVPPIVKKEKPEEPARGQSSRLASIPSTKGSASKAVESGGYVEDADDKEEDSNEKDKKSPQNSKSRHGNSRQDDHADFDTDDYEDDDDYHEDDHDNEELFAPPKRKQKAPSPRPSSPTSPKKTGNTPRDTAPRDKGREAPHATGRSSTPTGESPVRQRAPRKEASNVSTSSAGRGSPPRKRVSQELKPRQNQNQN